MADGGGTGHRLDWPDRGRARLRCWAIDNNLTRKVSASDALFIAGSKGMIAGAVNCLLALSLGAMMPNAGIVLATMTIGVLGYGVSLVMFVLALRGLGTARTGAYFSTAPFIGAAVALGLLGESTDPAFWLAAGLMAWGVWLPFLRLTVDRLARSSTVSVDKYLSCSAHSARALASIVCPKKRRLIVDLESWLAARPGYSRLGPCVPAPGSQSPARRRSRLRARL